MKPIVKWSGGKKDEIKQFVDMFPQDIETYGEPFFGGGAVFFHLKPDKSVVSDLHKELIDFYISMKEGKGSDIYNFLNEHPNDEETYYKVRDDFKVESILDNAKRFFYLRKTCFRGMLRYNKKGKFNVPFGRYKTYNFEELKNEEYKTVLSNTEILNKSFEHVFEKCNNPKDFIFLDPPYDSEFSTYAKNEFNRDDQTRLANYMINECKANWMMVIKNTDFIFNLYNKSGINITSFDKKYLVSFMDRNDKDVQHLLITNY